MKIDLTNDEIEMLNNILTELSQDNEDGFLSMKMLKR